MHANYSRYGQQSLFIPLKLVYASSHIFFHYGQSRKIVCKNWNILTVYNVSQHYITRCILECIVAACTCVYPETMASGQVVTNIVGHVDTIWDTKQVYVRKTIKSKYVTIYGTNR